MSNATNDKRMATNPSIEICKNCVGEGFIFTALGDKEYCECSEGDRIRAEDDADRKAESAQD